MLSFSCLVSLSWFDLPDCQNRFGSSYIVVQLLKGAILLSHHLIVLFISLILPVVVMILVSPLFVLIVIDIRYLMPAGTFLVPIILFNPFLNQYAPLT